MLSKEDLKRRQAVATVRFGVIAPLVQNTYPDASMAEYARRMAKQPIEMPDGQVLFYSAKTIMRWKNIYDTEGMDGLMPKTRSDKGLSRSVPEEAQEEMKSLHAVFPRMSASQMRDRLIADMLISPDVSLSTIQRCLKKLKEEAPLLPPDGRERKAFEMEYANVLWQADTAYLPHLTTPEGRGRTYLMIIVDDYSRMIVGAEIFWHDNAVNFQTLMQKAVQMYGIPMKLLTDNGAPYANDQLQLILNSIGTVLIRAKPRDPQTKGKCERLIHTFRDQALAVLDPDSIHSLAEFNNLLQEWILEYNSKIHSTTKAAPRERFLSSVEDHPIRRPKTMEWLEECFFNRVVRRVNRDGTIQWNNTFYNAPMQFVGQKVEVWFSPSDLSSAFINFGDEHYPIRPTDRVANGKAKRKNRSTSVNYALEAGGSHAE